MDRLSKLQELLSEDQISTDGGAGDSPWNHIKPKHVYEGTDSEDNEDIIRAVEPPQSYWNPDAAGATGMSDGHGELTEYQLTLGDLAAEGEMFCPWQILKKYPYSFLGIAHREQVAENFFNGGKLFEQRWDFFYIHRHGSDSNRPAILLIPTKQLQAFLNVINQTLQLRLTIPSGGAGGAFQVTFANDGTPRPRYLGQSTTRDMAENLRAAIPPSWFKTKGEAALVKTPSDRSLAAFKAKINLMVQAQKDRRVVNKEKQKIDRIGNQQSWNHSTKRVQRYLGIRQASNEKPPTIVRAGLANSGLEWDNYHDALKADIPKSVDFDPHKPAPYDKEGDIVFVCIDVEANERSASQITEIGIATLDTRDLKILVPGKCGMNWHSKIRARHFRINEYKHIVNSKFVSGCPDRFEFGESEFINLGDAPSQVASCFKYPFSNFEVEQAPIDENELKRNIILVGHSIGVDINYLKSVGYDVYNLSNLQEIVDTALMWQSLKRDVNPRNLGSVLAELDLVGWNLHNAGNDAVYTLQAMIGISIKHLCEREKRKEVRQQEKKARVEEFVKEVTQSALEKEEGRSSAGENSDGGVPVVPVATGTKKPILQQPKKGAQFMQGPWRKPAQNVGMNASSHGSQVPAARPGNKLPASFEDWRRGIPVQRTTSVQSASSSASIRTSTVSAQNISPVSKNVVNLVKKTKLCTIETGEPAKENNRGGDWR